MKIIIINNVLYIAEIAEVIFNTVKASIIAVFVISMYAKIALKILNNQLDQYFQIHKQISKEI